MLTRRLGLTRLLLYQRMSLLQLTWEAFVSWLLQRPLAWVLGSLCVLQLALWIPHYITWPFWADHDVFATMALAWDAGELPYRDFRSNNFPGSTYLFWILGHTAGWANSAALYGFDVALLVTFGGLIVLWSGRTLGSRLFGLIGYAAVLTFYLSLDFTQTAQRDWYAALSAVSALMLSQLSPRYRSYVWSALAFAVGFLFRPHVVLFLPALAWTIVRRPNDTGWPARRVTAARLGIWTIGFTVFVGLGFVPLLRVGVLDDLLRSLRLWGYGPETDARALSERITEVMRLLLTSAKTLSIPVCMSVLAWRSGRQRLAAPWILSYLGALLYEPLSPYHHAYLTHPVWVIWCVQVAILAYLITQQHESGPSLRMVGILLLLSLSVTPKPKFCSVQGTLRAVGVLDAGDPSVAPPGYDGVPLYPWEDYQAVLNHIRTAVPAHTRVANLLYGVAIAGSTARLSALPAESITWLVLVSPEDEDRFIDALEHATDSIVVWVPTEERWRSRPRFVSVVQRLHQPHARFGDLEIWRRNTLLQSPVSYLPVHPRG